MSILTLLECMSYLIFVKKWDSKIKIIGVAIIIVKAIGYGSNVLKTEVKFIEIKG
jgi:hypothetical protein